MGTIANDGSGRDDMPEPWARILAAIAQILAHVFGFFSPTLYTRSWVPFLRALLVLLVILLVIAGTVMAVALTR